MPYGTAKEVRDRLEREHKDDDEIIAVIWSRSDFPRVWDQIMAAYNHHWQDALVEATGNALNDLCAGNDLPFDLQAENVKR